MKNIKIFVYDNLRRGNREHEIFLKDAVFIGEGYIDGYELYDVAGYLIAVRGNGRVDGEVYEVSKETLEEIDYYEEVSGLAKKIKEKVKCCDGRELCVYMYVGIDKKKIKMIGKKVIS